jgi:hypothetical protein
MLLKKDDGFEEGEALMNVFNADVVDELGEEKCKGGFSNRTICERLFKSIWMPAVDNDQLVRTRAHTLCAELSRCRVRLRIECWCK